MPERRLMEKRTIGKFSGMKQEQNPQPDGSGPRTLHVELDTHFGRITGNLPVPSAEMRLSELAWTALPLGEKLIGMAVKAETARSGPISCRKGCGACCRQAVPVSQPEAWMLADLVASMPPPRRKEILERFQKARERLDAEGFLARSLEKGSSREEFQTLGLDYFRLGIPCPFLEEESCSIHPYRPNSCREYLVTSPAENCAQVGRLPVKTVPMYNSVTEPLAQVAAKFLGGEPQLMPMTLAIGWAVEHRETGQRKFDSVELMTELLKAMFPEKSPEPAA
jgi:Fe-S-cluster containining protein